MMRQQKDKLQNNRIKNDRINCNHTATNQNKKIHSSHLSSNEVFSETTKHLSILQRQLDFKSLQSEMLKVQA